MVPRQKAELAFVADNPGDWMLRCHVLAHQAGGMMTMVRVALKIGLTSTCVHGRERGEPVMPIVYPADMPACALKTYC
jgi:hypothetical protein